MMGVNPRRRTPILYNATLMQLGDAIMFKFHCRSAIQFLVCVSLCLLTARAHAQQTQPYSGCGLLAMGVECPQFIGDDGASFSIVNIGEFSIGDRVFVSGMICFNCPNICQQGPVFQANQISICIIIPPHEFLFDECGTLVLTPNPGSCLLFQAESGGLYWVENLEGFMPGDFVRITSDHVSTPCFSLCMAELVACVEDNNILACLAPPLSLDTCGTLVKHPIGEAFCVVFEDDEGNAWLLADQGDFEVGDRLHVTGIVSFCTPLCGNVVGCVSNPPPVGCFGDINNDGGVDALDLLAVISHWGPCPRCAEDLNGDGAVNVADLLLVIGNWSAS